MNHFLRISISLALVGGVSLHAAGPELSESSVESVGEALPETAAPAESPPATDPAPHTDPTVIDSDRLEMISGEEETRFIFSGNVSVTGNNLVVLCDRLEVTTDRFEENEPLAENPNSGKSLDDGETGGRDAARPESSGDSSTAGGSPADFGRLRIILATGNVRITQDGREATAGRAELRPREGLIILTENPVFRDAQGTVSGPRIVLDQNRSEAVVEGTAEQRARVTLPSLPDFSPGSGRSRETESPPREP